MHVLDSPTIRQTIDSRKRNGLVMTRSILSRSVTLPSSSGWVGFTLLKAKEKPSHGV